MKKSKKSKKKKPFPGKRLSEKYGPAKGILREKSETPHADALQRASLNMIGKLNIADKARHNARELQ